MFWLFNRLPKKRKAKAASGDAVAVSRAPKSHEPAPRWMRELLDSLERNNLAPSEDVIQHCFVLFKDELDEPGRGRRLVLAEHYADILGDVARLRGLAPHLIEQAIASSPYAFSQVIDHKVAR